MDHKLAENLQAAQKYTLNEMSADERLQFEEHLFDCPICADELRQNFTVVENLKAVLTEERFAQSAAPAGWRKWLTLPSLVPAMVALALAGVIVVQNVRVPNVTPPSSDVQAEILPSTPVLAPVSRGAVETIKINRSKPHFSLSFDVDSKQPDSFLCEFDNTYGKKILALNSAPQSQAAVKLQFLLPTGNFPAGRYEMLLRPASEPASITKYPFIIEDSK